jgi:hypothetical protein
MLNALDENPGTHGFLGCSTVAVQVNMRIASLIALLLLRKQSIKSRNHVQVKREDRSTNNRSEDAL